MHLSTPGRLALLLAPVLALALPTPKDAKFFNPSDDPYVTDLGQKTGRIGIDIVDPSHLRVDPVRVLDHIARSSSKMSSLTKRRNVALVGERKKGESAAAAEGAVTGEGKEDGADVRRAQVQVDPVEANVHVFRPSPMVVPAHEGQQQETGSTGDMPQFRPEYDAGDWRRYYH
ncbi:hypothetical protein LZ32DRAFT_617573 [Colletotrichum eremochloae]|nr:hypothetical protein LZ32DRAFT_617573 [Colletotrichum eremochloae]